MLKVSTDKMDSIQDEALDLSLPKMRKRDDDSFNNPPKRPDATPENGSHIGCPKPEAMSFNYVYQPLEQGLNSRNTCKQERDEATSKHRDVEETESETSDMRMSSVATKEPDDYTRSVVAVQEVPEEIETVVINDQEDKKHEDGTSDNSFRWDTFTGDETTACRSLTTRSNNGSPDTSVSDVGDYRHDPLQKDDSEPEADASNGSNVIQRRIGCITISLQDSHLWRAFANRGTEMIINKGGRYSGASVFVPPR